MMATLVYYSDNILPFFVSNLGLNPDVNNTITPFKEITNQHEPMKLHEGFQGFVPLPENGDTIDKNPNRKQLSEIDQQYIVNCMRKYKDNYKKMMLDIKTNSRQLTDNQLKRMAQKYLNLSEQERDIIL